jgi:hypothetical protein
MSWRSPRFLILLTVIIVLVVGIGVAAVLIFQAGHAKVSTQHTIAQKTVIPGNERQVVQSYNQAIIRQDWATMYASTAQSVIGSQTQEEFAQAMAQQVKNEGTISSIITTSNPEVKTNPDGLIYFTVFEKVVIVKNSLSQTISIVSVFILENGTWKYFTSKKL